jgi:hypothetical protein
LAHNPDWRHPRRQQLIRSYRKAHAAGIRLPRARTPLERT